MDDLKMLESLVKGLDRIIATAEKDGVEAIVIESLKGRRYQAELDLQGARGAKGLNPMTGAAA